MAAARRAPTAVAMLNMGGPSTLPEVQGFLTNLFTDPEIIPMGRAQPLVGPWVAKRRTPKITEQYAAIGGGSPILKWTNMQGEHMCRILDEIRPEVRVSEVMAVVGSVCGLTSAVIGWVERAAQALCGVPVREPAHGGGAQADEGGRRHARGRVLAGVLVCVCGW